MQKVHKLMAAGAPLSLAVRGALAPVSLRQLCLANGIQAPNLSAALSGTRAPDRKIIDALVNGLGGTPDEWRTLFLDTINRRAEAVVGQ